MNMRTRLVYVGPAGEVVHVLVPWSAADMIPPPTISFYLSGVDQPPYVYEYRRSEDLA